MKKIYKNNPLVSIIMNCHNGEKFLEQSLSSILKQSYKNWELIFWDNKSNDGSKKKFLKIKDKRFNYFFSKKYNKLYKARNLAIKKSRGEYICFLDTDDIWKSNKLKKQVNFLNKNKKSALVYTDYLIMKNSKIVGKISKSKSLYSGEITQNLLDNYNIGILTIMIRKKILEKIKFNSKLDIIGDFDLMLKISRKYLIGSIQEALAVYRIHENNYSKKKMNVYIKEIGEWIEINKKKKFKNFSFLNLEKEKNFLELKHNLINKNLLMLPNNILRCIYFYFYNIFGRVVQW